MAFGLAALVAACSGPGANVPSGDLRGPAEVDLPAPFQVQAVLVKDAANLSWQWQRPDATALFTKFGFEIYRDDRPLTVTDRQTFTDEDVPLGSHVYRIRVRAESRAAGSRQNHLSAWSEPASVTRTAECRVPPAVTLSVVPTKTVYRSIPSLRFELSGTVSTEPPCRLERFIYRIETGTGLPKTGPLEIDAKGRYRQSLDALGPEDEIPASGVTLSVTVVAENQAGISTSDAFTLDLEKEGRYDPGPR